MSYIESFVVLVILLAIGLIYLFYYRGESFEDFLCEVEISGRRRRWIAVLMPVIINLICFALLYYCNDYVVPDGGFKLVHHRTNRYVSRHATSILWVSSFIFGFAESYTRRKPYLTSAPLYSLPYIAAILAALLFKLPFMAESTFLQKAAGLTYFILLRESLSYKWTIADGLAFFTSGSAEVLSEALWASFLFLCFFSVGYFLGHRRAKSTDADKRWAEIQRKRQEKEDKIENKLKDE